jgi:hypothetical protein
VKIVKKNGKNVIANGKIKMSVRKSYTQSKIDGILDKIYLWSEKLTRNEKIYLNQYIKRKRGK